MVTVRALWVTLLHAPTNTQVSVESIRGDLAALGLEESVVLRLLEVIKSKDIAALEAEIGKDSPVRACVRACVRAWSRSGVGRHNC